MTNAEKDLAPLFQWIPRYMVPPWWMKRAYYSAVRNQFLMVAWPFNYFVLFAWWVNQVWRSYTVAESWIDKEIERRSKLK